MPVSKRVLDGICNLVASLIDIPKSVRFVDNNQIPWRLPNIGILGPRKLERAENDLLLIERIEVAALDLFVEGFGFENGRREKELVGKFLCPLFPQIGRANDK